MKLWISNLNLGDSAFSSITKAKNIKNDFVTYLFDGISIAIANLVDRIAVDKKNVKIEEKVYDIKIGSELQSYKTGTMSSLNKRIELFKEGVENVIDERWVKRTFGRWITVEIWRNKFF